MRRSPMRSRQIVGAIQERISTGGAYTLRDYAHAQESLQITSENSGGFHGTTDFYNTLNDQVSSFGCASAGVYGCGFCRPGNVDCGHVFADAIAWECVVDSQTPLGPAAPPPPTSPPLPPPTSPSPHPPPARSDVRYAVAACAGHTPAHLVVTDYSAANSPTYYAYSLKRWLSDAGASTTRFASSGYTTPDTATLASSQAEALDYCKAVYGPWVTGVVQSTVESIHPDVSSGGPLQVPATDTVNALGVYSTYTTLASEYLSHVGGHNTEMYYTQRLGCLPNAGMGDGTGAIPNPCGFCTQSSGNTFCGVASCKTAPAWECVAGTSPPSPLPQPPSPPEQPPSPPPPPPPFTACVDNCWPHNNDGFCDDGGQFSDYCTCPYGYDCTDCGWRSHADNLNFDRSWNCE